MASARYAIYYAPPPESAWWRFGNAWLGRDSATGESLTPPEAPGVTPEEQREATASPRRYGFHATLKPPFRLAESERESALLELARQFARRQRPFALPPLRVARLERFLAAVPAEPCPPLHALAEACVRTFDAFRAPPSAEELERRRRAGLTERQEALLQAWGYPYVLEEFIPHLTLTGPVADDELRGRLEAALEALTAPLAGERLPVDSLCVFHQPGPEAPFVLLERAPFGLDAPLSEGGARR